MERTLAILKPDCVRKNLIGEVYRRFEQAGLQIIASRMVHLTREKAEGFYAVHKERPFFNDPLAVLAPADDEGHRPEEREPPGRAAFGQQRQADLRRQPLTIRGNFVQGHLTVWLLDRRDPVSPM